MYLGILKVTGNWFQVLLGFQNNLHKKPSLGLKTKIKVYFMKTFDHPLSKYLISSIVTGGTRTF